MNDPYDNKNKLYDDNLDDKNDSCNNKEDPYNDIIDLPHHVSSTHPRMSVENRAAQFSPFAALTGYEAAVKETARRTEEKAELDEDAKATLDMKLHILADMINDNPKISLTYFKKDEMKSGGAYITVVDNIKKIDGYKKTMDLMKGKKLSIEDIIDIESDIFKDFL